MECEQLVATLPPVSESVAKVLCTLNEGQPMTMAQLQTQTGLARRTVYNAVAKLRELQLLEARTSLQDARQTWFWLPQDGSAAT